MLLAEILKKARTYKKVSLRGAALHVGCSFMHLHHIEQGKITRPKMELLHNLADYYGINRDEVVIAARRIPDDVYWKIVNNPDLIVGIREFSVL
jgi:transcriptional regulator with XRE-family HTH domain